MFHTWMNDPEAFQSDYEEYQEVMHEVAEEKSPSFFAIYGHMPVAGQDYDPDAVISQDDYEFYTGTGHYTNDPDEIPDDAPDDCVAGDGFFFKFHGT
jgi:hypothetical protein